MILTWPFFYLAPQLRPLFLTGRFRTWPFFYLAPQPRPLFLTGRFRTGLFFSQMLRSIAPSFIRTIYHPGHFLPIVWNFDIGIWDVSHFVWVRMQLERKSLRGIPNKPSVSEGAIKDDEAISLFSTLRLLRCSHRSDISDRCLRLAMTSNPYKIEENGNL